MPIRRSYAEYGDACAAAHALDIVGDRWAVIVMRELMLGPKRFSELLAGAHGATPTAVTMRLRELEQAGIVDRVELPPPARVDVYQLTEWGRDFEPILQALGRWAQRSPTRSLDGALTPDAAVLALRTMADGPAPSPSLAFDLGLHDDRSPKRIQSWYHVLWGSDSLVADKLTHQVGSADAIACDSAVWTELMFGTEDSDALLESDAVNARGEGRLLAKRFLVHFRPSTPPAQT
jgi:DNA-binding HxlR family transcriptional regulator